MRRQNTQPDTEADRHVKGSAKEPNISIYFFFLPITQWWSIFGVLFTGGRWVSDFSGL